MFEKYPSTLRLGNVRWFITEKIDGTNAQVNITEDGLFECGSRNQLITPENDNAGFANWAYAHKEDLVKVLGPGRHFGEWWGRGIQRTYGLDEKKFSLFNPFLLKGGELPFLSTVPCLETGKGVVQAMSALTKWETILRNDGSKAAPGYMRPEGLILKFENSKPFKHIWDK